MRRTGPPLFLSALLTAVLLWSCRGTTPPPASTGETLRFESTEANVHDYFLRRGPVATHLLTTSGEAPRVVWGFPAENTGIGIWFYPPARPATLSVEGGLQPVEFDNGMRGVTAEIHSDASLLRIKKAVLGNVRTVRDYFYGATLAPEFDHTLRTVGTSLWMDLNCLDGEHHVQLRIEMLEGTTGGVEGSTIVFHGGKEGRIRLRTTALTDYTPLTPIPIGELVTAEAANNARALNALAFLAYKEKLLAGSWRFLTYFGRDTLLSLRMLMPVLQPTVMEAGLGGVLDRVNAEGVVAHEEALGDYAWYTRVQRKEPPPPPPQDMFSPWLDYKMIDGDFLLPAVLADYHATPEGQSRMAAFLARTTPSGERYQDVLRRNIEHVVALATPFVTTPTATHLIAIQHETVGNWRDSGEGLGRGIYPYDVNVSLVPAALRGAARLYASGLLGAEPTRVTPLEAMAQVWETQAPPLFEVRIPLEDARGRVEAYARSLGLDPQPALEALGPSEVTLSGVALRSDGTPVPIMNSDDGFVMLFNTPSAAFLQQAAMRLLRPFPAGLRTDAGIVVANAVFATPEEQARFTRGDYHGAVVWSWQQAMLAAGLERQLKRTDLDEPTRAALRSAQMALWRVIQENAQQSTGELWSWKAEGGRAVYDSFAAAATAENRFVDESNAIQLWSTVYLAVKPPPSP
ncbi:hypothetical protein [Melittangium boletus]|uniref:Lipoprotein n=1 Tax=Melittangium boletus DSM 14713 TaxID=1294270 RepID=A0A250IJW0_9BACT|nr:hypothetical protein [Melittangium boletus]ATB31503.1 hypothetical protein MEBOL_004966 [Melittangium boletus DSM 14713]